MVWICEFENAEEEEERLHFRPAEQGRAENRRQRDERTRHADGGEEV